jgi:beta-lactam-binding protein with PASTA domain
MSLLPVIVIIVLVGVLLWALNSFIPMDTKIRNILNAVVVIALIVWLLQGFGVLGSIANIRIG